MSPKTDIKNKDLSWIYNTIFLAYKVIISSITGELYYEGFYGQRMFFFKNGYKSRLPSH